MRLKLWCIRDDGAEVTIASDGAHVSLAEVEGLWQDFLHACGYVWYEEDET